MMAGFNDLCDSSNLEHLLVYSINWMGKFHFVQEPLFLSSHYPMYICKDESS